MITPRSQRIAAVAILFAAHSVATADDATISLNSGATEVPLVELYTSEGCSSCPPADRWLSRLETDPTLWQNFTPVAFHVDYWNDIGWEDRFSQAAWSDRQRRYAIEGGVRTVYTPGVFRAGAEWTAWRRADAPDASNQRVGELRVDILGDQLEARFDPAVDSADALTLHIAVLGMNLKTHVRAGENRGKTLTHDFVVLAVESTTLTRASSDYRASARLPDANIRSRRRAVAVWVTSGQRQAPIQSVGGFLP